jgi:hypothetical protein
LVGKRFARALLLAIFSTAAHGGCARPSSSGADAAAIERAALRTLFLEREHGQQLVLLRTTRDSAPVLGDVDFPVTDALVQPDMRLLAMPVPVTVVTMHHVDSVFRANPDGWAAWYARYPVSSGLIEMTQPRMMIDSNGRLAATLIVARSCGDHCRSAWQVSVRRDARGTWRTELVVPLRLPRT